VSRPDHERGVIRAGIGLGLAVGVFGVSFGALAVAAGLSTAQTCVLSLFAFTGGSQLAYVGVLSAGGTAGSAAASAVLLGSRNMLYGVTLGPRLAVPPRLRPLAAQLVIDETTAMATVPGLSRRLARLAFASTGLAVYVCWNVSTLVGALLGGAVGNPAALGLDAVGPAAFLALLWPRLRAGVRGTRWVAATGALLGVAGAVVLPVGLAVPLAALAVLAGGRPRTARPPAGQPRTGQPGTGQPGTGQQETGQPAGGDTRGVRG